MSYAEYLKLMDNAGVRRTDAENGEITLNKHDTIEALKLLRDTEVGVLGGDVYELESDGYFRPTHDNWYCAREGDNQETFARKSQQKAHDFLVNYDEQNNKNIRYVLVLDI